MAVLGKQVGVIQVVEPTDTTELDELVANESVEQTEREHEHV